MTHENGEVPQESGSPMMREATELAGHWVVKTATAQCAVTFAMQRIESANGWTLVDPSACLAGVVPGAVAWRPTPEGVALAAADRRTLALFSWERSGAVATAALPGGTATLHRT